jgi:hypothetical protein
VCQTTCITKSLKLSSFVGHLNNIAIPHLELTVKKRATDDAVVCQKPSSFNSTEATFDVPSHLFALDSESMLSLTGFLFELHYTQTLVAEGTILFAQFMGSSHGSSEPVIDGAIAGSSAVFSSNASVVHEDSSDVRVLPPIENVGKHTTERAFNFRTTLNSPVDGTAAAEIEGRIVLDRTITFAQMPHGLTVDGVVCGTPIAGFVRPPFLHADDAEVRREGGQPNQPGIV